MKGLDQVRFLVVHHSGSPRSTQTGTIASWHLERGWEAIGYHWIIEGDGAVVPGRSLFLQGAHAPSVNGKSWGVCVTGDNTTPEPSAANWRKVDQRWNDVQRQSLLRLIQAVRLLVPMVQVVRHCDVRHTTCPGLTLDEFETLAGGVST